MALPMLAREAESDPRQVIVVDDSPDILYLAGKKLRAAGFKPIEAANGVEALQRMIDHPGCRRILTDYVMPMLGGNYWVRILERFCHDWTVVVVSTEDIDPGPFICVPKPVDYENIITVFSLGAQ